MKGTISLTIALIIFIGVSAEAFIEKRKEWWDIRLNKFEQRKVHMPVSAKAYGLVGKTVETEIESAKNIIKIFESGMAGENYAVHDYRKFSEAEVALEVDKVLKGIFSIYYLDVFSTEPLNSEYIERAIRAASNEIVKLPEFRTLPGDDKSLKKLTGKIPRDIWKKASEDMVLSSIVNDRQGVYEKIKSSLTAEIIKGTGLAETCTRDIQKRVVNLSKKYISRYDMTSCMEDFDKHLNGSPYWNMILFSIKSEGTVSRIDPHLYSLKLKRILYYMNYIRDMALDSTEAAIAFHELHALYSHSMARASSMMSHLTDQGTIDKNLTVSLSITDHKKIRELKAEFNGEAASIKNELSQSYKNFSANRFASSSQAAREKKTLNRSLALNEMEALFRSIDAYSKLYDSLRYSDEIIALYSIQHAKLLKSAAGGKVTPDLDSVIKNDSILASIENFNRERYESELEAKAYIKSQASKDIAALTSLLDFYTRSAVSTNGAPTRDDISSINKKLHRRVEAHVSSWHLNENNLYETDRKAAKELSTVLNRKMWNMRPGENDDKSGSAFSRYIIPELNMTLSLPFGWIEKADDGNNQEKKILKEFVNSDSRSSITVIKLPIENRPLKEISDAWLIKSNITPLKSRWDEGSSGYYWALSRAEDLSVVESYALFKNGFAYIISARCDKNKHGFMKNMLKEMMSSISL